MQGGQGDVDDEEVERAEEGADQQDDEAKPSPWVRFGQDVVAPEFAGCTECRRRPYKSSTVCR